MIGDFQGLFRSLRAFKAFAAYNMVLLHAVSIMHPVLAAHGYQDHLVRGSMLRGLFSITLPAFAGFYLRHALGPYLVEGRLRDSLWPRMKDLILFAFVFEAVRLYTITYDIGWSFAWQALHFIVLSILVTYLCLRKGTRFLIGLVVLDLVLLQFVKVDRFPIAASVYPVGKWLQCLALGLLLSWAVWRWKQLRFLSLLAFVSGFLLMFFFGFNDPKTLESFLQLPVGIFTYIPGSINYLPFFPLYPLFLAGYFFRGFFFDMKNKKWFVPVTILMAVFLVGGGYFAFSGVDAGVRNVFSTEIYRRGIPGAAFFVSLFFFDWMLFYFLLKGGRFPFLDRIVRWSGNVLSLYFIHWGLFYFLRIFLLKNPGIVSAFGGLPFLYVVMHVVYGLCVYLSYNFVTFSERFKRTAGGPGLPVG